VTLSIPVCVWCVQRCLSENNQTASILDSLRPEHEGVYRCVAYGHRTGDVISNEVKLVLKGRKITAGFSVVKLKFRLH